MLRDSIKRGWKWHAMHRSHLCSVQKCFGNSRNWRNPDFIVAFNVFSVDNGARKSVIPPYLKRMWERWPGSIRKKKLIRATVIDSCKRHDFSSVCSWWMTRSFLFLHVCRGFCCKSLISHKSKCVLQGTCDNSQRVQRPAFVAEAAQTVLPFSNIVLILWHTFAVY